MLIDTDIGSDVDDAFALALAVASPEIDLVGVTTVGEAPEDRAWLVCRFLTQVGLKNVPVQVWSTKGFQSQWLTPLDAGICGVHVGSRAAERAADALGVYGMVAPDLLPHIAYAMRDIMGV